ncbi:MAG: hypothetical protein CL610_15685 [Anaerolineaceae bacterium]|nr:hypothetical protein [Anaerolineaceae bacterium]
MAEGWQQVWKDIINSIRGGVESGTESPIKLSGSGENANLEIETPAAPESGTETSGSDVLSAPQQAASAQPLPLDVENEASIESPFGSTVSATAPKHSWYEWLRANVVFPAAAIILLIIVLLSTRGGPLSLPQPPAPDVIATFNGGQITIADLEKHLALIIPGELQEVTRSPVALELAVQDLVTDELARRWAAERQPDSDDTFTHTMEHITEEINLESFDTQLHEDATMVSESEIQDYYYQNREQFGDQSLDAVRESIRQTLVAEREQDYLDNYIQRLKDNASVTRNFELLEVPPPTEDDLRIYYDENITQFTLPSQVVIDQLEIPIGQDEVASRQKAEAALLSVNSGASFEEAQQQDPSLILSAGQVIQEGTTVNPEWDAIVFGLTPGEISDVFRAGNSFYIVLMNERQDERIQAFEQIRETIQARVQQQQADTWFEENADKTLFTIKGRRYTVGQFYNEYQELSPPVRASFSGSEGMRNLAEQLIERLLLIEDTNDQLLGSENQPLTDEARLQVLKQMQHQEEVDDQIEVTEQEIQQYYDANQELMIMPSRARIRYIRIGLGASEDEAKRAQERADEAYNRLVPGPLQSGEEFAKIAQEYSEDPETATNGGEYPGWIGESSDILAELEMHPFHERVLTLQPGEISPVFQYGDSLYIVQVIERTEPETLSLEQAGPFIEEILFEQEHDTLTAQLQQQLLDESDFVLYPSVLEEYFNRSITPVPQ